jgi:ketosteroid isomerase-like protein
MDADMDNVTGMLINKADVAAVTTVVESVATLADRGDFDALEALYAPEVRLDYSSLAGGEPEVISPQALMTRWAGVLPGFDRTRHDVSGIAVTIDGDRAIATANVVADHWIGDKRWRVAGRYDYELARDGRDWRIDAHRFTVTGESGSRDVFAQASEAAAEHPPVYVLRQQARAAVLQFLTGLEDKDMDRVNAVWAEDAAQEMPYAPDGFPKRVAGRAALIAHYSAWPENSGRARFTDEIRFYPMQDPSTVFAEWRGVTKVVPTGRTYDQRYGGLFHVVDSRIALFREYYDPTVFARAFGLNEGGRFNQDY